MQKYKWLLLSKVKKIAEDFLAKYPTMFSADFKANKKSLDQLAIIRNRALRNQIAGAITALAADKEPESDGIEIGESQVTQVSEPDSPESVAQQAQ